jgi:flagellar basal body-associated protein FliL
VNVDVIKDGDDTPNKGGLPTAVVVVIIVVVVVAFLAAGAIVVILLYRRKAKLKGEKTENLVDRRASEMEVMESSLPPSRGPKKKGGF